MAFLTLVKGKDGASGLGWIDMRTGDTIRRILGLQASSYSNDRARAYALTSDRATKTATINVTDLDTQVMREIYRGTECTSGRGLVRRRQANLLQHRPRDG
jgi:hypothetical protein